jgi:hypothetical protein
LLTAAWPPGPVAAGILQTAAADTTMDWAEVIESIIRPAAVVAQGFATNWFTTTGGQEVSGFVVREGQDDVVIRGPTNLPSGEKKGP